jgi:hypothetical protein
MFALSATRVRPVKHCSPFPLIGSLAPAQIEKLKDRTPEFVRKLARSARRIRKIFEIEEERYAAEIC